MNIIILYYSRSGQTKSLANNIATAVAEQGHTTTVKSVMEVSTADVESADMLFIGTWVHGLILFNVRPANADLWTKALPDLNGKPVATFCTYAFNPRQSLMTLNSLLEERGATIVGQQAFHRDQTDDGVSEFTQTMLQSLVATV